METFILCDMEKVFIFDQKRKIIFKIGLTLWKPCGSMNLEIVGLSRFPQ